MEITKELITAVKLSLKKAPYWNLVQDETKQRVELIANNITTLGPLFRSAFLEFFKYEHACRMATGDNVPALVPGVLFGESMSEECYQSGIAPAKALLHLNDWTMPNEADVQICIALCHAVDKLQVLFNSKPVSDLLLESTENPTQN